METHIKATVTVGKSALSGINHLTIDQRADWHHSFTVDVPLDVFSGNDRFKSAKENIGQKITIELKAEQAKGSADAGDSVTQSKYRSGSFVFKGMITSISLTKSKGNSSSVVIKGYSPTVMLEDGLATKAFSEKTLSQIFNDVISPYKSNLPSQVKPSPDPKLGYCVQYNESNYNFLSRLTAAYGQWFFYDGENLHIGKLDKGAQTLKLTFGVDLESYNFDLKLAPLKFTAKSYDYITNAQFEVKSDSVEIGSLKEDEDVNALLPKAEDFFKNASIHRPQEFLKNQSDLKSVMQYKKAGIAGSMVVLTGNSNEFRLKIGAKIKINTNASDKSSSIEDEFIISHVNHFIDNVGNYHNSFDAIPKEIDFPPMHKNYSLPVCETQPAKVVKNVDKEGMGRIKVRFYWQADGEASPWIRMVSSHAGKNKGFQFIPEVDDEVLVAFENNNPSFPYVIGSMYHGKAKHEDRKDNDNYVKTIRTVSGNEIRIYDKSGEEEISIYNKDKQNEVTMTLKDDGKITIKSKNKIAISGKDITVDAEKTIKMSAEDITISGKKSVKIETEQKCDIKGMDIKIAANNSLKAEAAANAEIKANAGIKIDGGPTTSIKSSGMMELNGGGQATLKAGIVMIN